MALKPWTMSFKESNPDEIKLHEILDQKTSPMAFAKDILIDVLVRNKNIDSATLTTNTLTEKHTDKDEISEIFGLD